MEANVDLNKEKMWFEWWIWGGCANFEESIENGVENDRSKAVFPMWFFFLAENNFNFFIGFREWYLRPIVEWIRELLLSGLEVFNLW